MAEWALKQDFGTELPGNEFFALLLIFSNQITALSHRQA